KPPSRSPRRVQLVAAGARPAGRRLAASHQRRRDRKVRSELAPGDEDRPRVRDHHRKHLGTGAGRLTMRAFTYSIHIDPTPEHVLNSHTDLTQSPKWRTMVKSTEVVGGGPLRAGAQLRLVMEGYGKVAERITMVSEFDPPRRLVMRSATGDVSGEFAST